MKGSGAPHACVAGNEILIRTVLRAAENQHLHRSCFLHRRKPKFPPKQSPGERERVATLSHPVTRGGVGERSAPRSRRRKPKSSKEQPFTSPKTSISTEAVSCIVGNRNSRQPSPGRAREGRNPLAPRPPRWGRRGAERPTPASSETKSFKRIACFVGNQFLHQNSPWESSRGCEPSRLPIEAGDLRGGKVACPKGKQVASRPTKRNRRFRLVAPGR